LEITSLNAALSAASGSSLQVSYTVRNNGPNPSSNTWWNERVYLSNNPNSIVGATLLSSPTSSGVVANGNSYNKTVSVTIPNGISGSYFLILQVDPTLHLTADTTRANNQEFRAIQINLTPPPDLEPVSFAFPTGLVYGSQQFYVPYTVTNNGPGVISGANVTDGVYLSNQPSITNTSTSLGTRQRTRTLAVGASYSDSILVSIPAWATGNYFIIFKTDVLDVVYEVPNEGNNTFSLVKFISPASLLNTDLVIASVSAPDSMLMGKPYQVQYQLANVGSTRATGFTRDAVFFGKQPTYTATSEVLFEQINRNINIQPGDTASFVLNGRMPGLNPNNYFVIMRANIRASIPEINMNNNDLTAGLINIDATELTLEVLDSNITDVNEPVYYKVTVGAGNDLLVTLTSNQAASGFNEIFVAYNRVPTPANHDFAQATGFGLNQIALVPNTIAGTYYIMINPQTQFGNKQRIGVVAQSLPYQIISSTP
ncbi:MAG: hypothetical protein LAT81_16200, partial [Oceanicaulis sp.]|nr:hypothetical protein [Oceanicaulis sp.]